MVEKVDYYRLFTNGHNGFSKELYLYLKKEGLISSSYEALANKNNGINYELYKIIQNNHPTEPALMTYRAMELSKEGVEYWLANSLYEVMRMYNAYFIVKDENNVPLSNVTIIVGDSFTRTNAEGIGIINLKNGVYQVSIGKYGYKAYDDSITIEDEDYVGNVSLKILTTFDDVNTIVDDSLSDYYTKPETEEYVTNAISSIEAFKHVIVSELPDVGDKNTIYLIEESSTSHVTVFKSYIYLNNQWCNIGNQIVDLSDYYTKLEADNVINTKIGSAIAGITSYKMIIVDKLPETGGEGLIYLIKENPDDEFYIMNVWISNEWVKIGSTRLDLSNYDTKEEVNTKISRMLMWYDTSTQVDKKINNSLSNYDTKEEVNTKIEKENTKIEEKISKITPFKYLIVPSLPRVGDKNIIYFIETPNNVYRAYIYDYDLRKWCNFGNNIDDLSKFQEEIETLIKNIKDNIKIYNDFDDFPETGEKGIIYVIPRTNKIDDYDNFEKYVWINKVQKYERISQKIIQSDWNNTDQISQSFIKNKPNLDRINFVYHEGKLTNPPVDKRRLYLEEQADFEDPEYIIKYWNDYGTHRDPHWAAIGLTRSDLDIYATKEEVGDLVQTIGQTIMDQIMSRMMDKILDNVFESFLRKLVVSPRQLFSLIFDAIIESEIVALSSSIGKVKDDVKYLKDEVITIESNLEIVNERIQAAFTNLEEGLKYYL